MGAAANLTSKRRRGGPRRKSAARHKNGRLKYAPSTDHGHELTQLRRGQLAGADALDQHAGYPLGVLFLRGDRGRPDGGLGDPWGGPKEARQQNAERHDAGLRFAADHAIAFGGNGTAKSHLAAIVDGIRGQSTAEPTKAEADARARFNRKVAAVKAACGNGAALAVLQNIVIEERYALTPPGLDLLRRALGALVRAR